MKRRIISVVMALSMAAVMLTGCGNDRGDAASELVVDTESTDENVTDETTEVDNVEEPETEAILPVDDVTVKVGGLKGATSIGTLFMKQSSEAGELAQGYEFSMYTAADELLPLVIKGELDIALLPANVASILYNKTEGGISVIDINTLGVLYMVSGDNTIKTPADLVGKTIYLMGKGTTPDYVLHYILSQNNIEKSELTLEYKSEATEVAAILANEPDAVGLLPQPFVTVACAQNEALGIVMDMNEQWNICKSDGDGDMVTGVTIVRNDFLQEHPYAVAHFLEDHAQSVYMLENDVESAAKLAVKSEIIGKEPVALKAIPKCNIVNITGEDMKKALSGYLEVLYGQDPAAVGGTLPGEEFYYIQ